MGSQLGSQWRPTPRDSLRQSATIIAVRWLVERRQATYRDAPSMPSKQRVAGSNPAGRARERMSQRPGRNAAHCPGWPLQPQRCFASRCAGRACGAPLTLETSASPAGLTARARPEARPETRAARPRQLTKGREKRSLHHRRSAIDLIVPLVRQSSLLAA